MKMAHAGLLLVVGVVSTTLLMGTNGETHTVGDSSGWSTPSNASFYSNWASRHNFSVGDVLVFNFSRQHTVATVDESHYSSCNTTSPIGTAATSPVRIALNTTGMYYYFCTIANHCDSGQKLAVNVTGTGTSSNKTSSSSPPPPPTSHSGAMATVASFYLVCKSLVIGLLML